ncbi:MAG: 2-oxoacid:acceptor oxidoreductase subunit alpha [bacterium]
MSTKIFTWKIGGDAGQGQQVAGLILAKVCAAAGFHSFVYSDYPSLLRGGLVTNQVSISKESVEAAYRQIDLYFALSQEALDNIIVDNKNYLSVGASIFYDENKVSKPSKKIRSVNFYPLDINGLLRQAGLEKFAANSLILGLTFSLLNGDLALLNKEIRKSFSGKGNDIVNQNKKAVKIGFNYAKNLNLSNCLYDLKSSGKNGKYRLLTGNEGAALGAVAAGCNFYSAYPMTPATSILHNLAKWASKVGMIVKHTEDEISAINMAVGASWAGARAMTGTSGGGFALMTEGLSLTGMTETPLVIIDAQRPGPATGLPTWTGQEDLQFLSKAGHGEFLRVILAPSSAEEAFYFTQIAFNLADVYQIPVFILLDKYLSESYQTTLLDLSNSKIDRGAILTESQLAKIDDYRRYVLNCDGGVSPRSLLGQKNGIFVANSDEHEEHGYSIEGFNPEMRDNQVKKRFAKLNNLLSDLSKPELIGPKKAELTLVGWGSVKGVVVEALKTVNQKKNKANYLHLSTPYPLDSKLLTQMLKNRNVVVVENNYTGQLANLLQESLGQKFDKRLNKYNGHQFYPEEILDFLK